MQGDLDIDTRAHGEGTMGSLELYYQGTKDLPEGGTPEHPHQHFPRAFKRSEAQNYDLGLLVFRSERELVPNVLSHPVSGTYLQQLRDLILQRSDHVTHSCPFELHGPLRYTLTLFDN